MGFHTKAEGYVGPANPGYCDAASMISKGWNKVRDVLLCERYFMTSVCVHTLCHKVMVFPVFSYCDIFSSVLLLQALFPWGCVGYELDDVRSHPTFAHSMPRPIWVLLSVINYFRWAHVGIISSSDDTWVETATKV